MKEIFSIFPSSAPSPLHSHVPFFLSKVGANDLNLILSLLASFLVVLTTLSNKRHHTTTSFPLPELLAVSPAIPIADFYLTMAQPQYTYSPLPNELAYYDALFQTADKAHLGYLSGQTAVEFLSTSKLPMDLLKTIWNLSDQNPQSNTLDKPKFYVAVRLIQLFQNGKKPVDSELHLEEGAVVRPPFFEGVPSMPMSAPQQTPRGSPSMQPQQVPTPQQSPMRPVLQTALSAASLPQQQPPQMQPQPSQHPPQMQLATQDPYQMTPPEQSRYESLFSTYASPDGYVYGPQAVDLFSKSGMDRNQLRDVWNMSDGDPVDNRLDPVEFAIAMHLIVCVTKKGLGMPGAGELPPSLARVRRESRQNQQNQGQQPNQNQNPQQNQNHQQGTVAPSSPGGIPSPDKMPGMGMPQMQGMQQQQQMQQQPPPTPQQQQLQPQLGQPQQQQPLMQQQQSGFPVAATLGGETVDDAFADLTPEPVNEDEYSVAPSVAPSTMGGGFGSGASATGSTMMGAAMTYNQQYQQPASPKPTAAPALYEPASPQQSVSAAAAPSLPVSLSPPRQAVAHPHHPQQKQQQQLPPKSPTHTAKSAPASASDLEHLRTAHQKLQAEVISLRAKASLVSDEERDAQSEIAKVASAIAVLSSELSSLRGGVAEAKVQLAEAVVTLKAMREEKETLEEAVKDTRETHAALTDATEAVREASEFAMELKAKAVSQHAKEVEASSQPVETADLFSWDATPAPASVPVAQGLDAWDAPAPSSQVHAPAPAMGSTWDAPTPSQVPAPATPLRVDTDAYSVGGNRASVNNEDDNASKFGDSHSVYTTNPAQNPAVPNGIANPNPYGAYQGGADNAYSFPMGVAPVPAAAPMGASPYGGDVMGGGNPAPTPVAATHQRNVSSSSAQQPPPPINSPTAGEVETYKKEALKAEKSFRASEDLVRTLSREVESLESAAKKADEEAKKLEAASQKKKGSFVSGKKKVKKEYERAAEIAAAEKKKVEEARQQLNAAQNEESLAREEAEKLRQQYEQAEIEAATAASYMSVQAAAATQQAQPAQQHVEPAPVANQYVDPFGMGFSGNNTNASDPYGMGLMGGSAQNQGDYSNPFAM